MQVLLLKYCKVYYSFIIVKPLIYFLGDLFCCILFLLCFYNSTALTVCGFLPFKGKKKKKIHLTYIVTSRIANHLI